MHQLPYSQQNSPWYPLDRRLCGPQSWYGHIGEEKSSHQPLPGLEPLIIQPLIPFLYVNIVDKALLNKPSSQTMWVM